MKGGVTSGIVYPAAVTELSTTYRFRRIGGSSAGAIAAALTAAAEYHRREKSGREGGTTPSTAGFARLQMLTAQLVDGDNLARLFAPAPRVRLAFDLLLVVMDRQRSILERIRRAALIVVRAAPLVFAAVTVLGLLPGLLTAAALTGGERWDAVLTTSAVWLLPAVVVGLIAAAIRAGVGTMRGLTENGYGISTGHTKGADSTTRTTSESRAVPPLTDWLHESINEAAGLPASGRPLTFGDLWGPEATDRYLGWVRERPGGPELSGVEREALDPLIDLLVTTTCLTQGVPYTFPFADDSFHFCRACLGEYFPEQVVAHLVGHGRPAREWVQQFSADCPRHPGITVQRLPAAHELPVVLAARLSLSLPLLISAVPLCYLDDGKVEEQRGLVTAWFSDGGITSNLPLHFFDTPLPRRPTFGINLLEADSRYPGDDTYLSPAGAHRPVPRERRIASVWDFVWAIIETMQNWQDALQAAAPGFRDRIVEVYLPPDEGGLNLMMTDEQIASLAARGARAGRRVLDEFDFTTHRWLRFRVAMNGYSVALEKHRSTYPDFAAATPSPWTGPYRLPPDIDPVVRAQAEQLARVGQEWRAQGHPATIDPPSPEPVLRFVPRR